MAEIARRYPPNAGTVEEMIALRPDLVVSMVGRGGRERFLLERLGIPFHELPIPDSLPSLRAAIQDLAARLGRRERGEGLLATVDRGPTDGRRMRGSKPVRVLLYGPNGYTFGPETLPGALLARAGLDNLALDLGIRSYGELPLERVIAAAPDLLIVMGAAASSQAERLLSHSALRGLETRVRRIDIAQRLLLCPGPWTVDALRSLSAGASAHPSSVP